MKNSKARCPTHLGGLWDLLTLQFPYTIDVNCQPNIIYMKLYKYISTVKKMYKICLMHQVSFPLSAEKGPDATQNCQVTLAFGDQDLTELIVFLPSKKRGWGCVSCGWQTELACGEPSSAPFNNHHKITTIEFNLRKQT